MASSPVSIHGIKDIYKKAPEAALGAALASIALAFMTGTALHSEWAKYVCAGIAVLFTILSAIAFIQALRKLWKA